MLVSYLVNDTWSLPSLSRSTSSHFISQFDVIVSCVSFYLNLKWLTFSSISIDQEVFSNRAKNTRTVNDGKQVKTSIIFVFRSLYDPPHGAGATKKGQETIFARIEWKMSRKQGRDRIRYCCYNNQFRINSCPTHFHCGYCCRCCCCHAGVCCPVQ